MTFQVDNVDDDEEDDEDVDGRERHSELTMRTTMKRLLKMWICRRE